MLPSTARIWAPAEAAAASWVHSQGSEALWASSVEEQGIETMEEVCAADEGAGPQSWRVPRSSTAARSLSVLEEHHCCEGRGEGGEGWWCASHVSLETCYASLEAGEVVSLIWVISLFDISRSTRTPNLIYVVGKSWNTVQMYYSM